jgi:hypothetical protein
MMFIYANDKHGSQKAVTTSVRDYKAGAGP